MRNREELFERLHTEDLKKLKHSPNEKSKVLSPSRTKDEIIQHLYSDYFVRDTKLKTL